jgi:SWIM/SEC-C metal-binding protein
MAKLGSEENPIIVHVRTDERAKYVAQQCTLHGWQYIIGFELDKPEDISNLERALHPILPAHSEKTGRNDPCSCGSGKKYKKCCSAV